MFHEQCLRFWPLAWLARRRSLSSTNARCADIRLHHQLQVVLARRNLVQLATAWWCDSHAVHSRLAAHEVVTHAEQTRGFGHPERRVTRAVRRGQSVTRPMQALDVHYFLPKPYLDQLARNLIALTTAPGSTSPQPLSSRRDASSSRTPTRDRSELISAA
jgi:hypothetical protein